MSIKAVCVLNGEKAKGTVWFTQEAEGKPVEVKADLTGLSEGVHCNL